VLVNAPSRHRGWRVGDAVEVAMAMRPAEVADLPVGTLDGWVVTDGAGAPLDGPLIATSERAVRLALGSWGLGPA
jgi:hypothetical protein